MAAPGTKRSLASARAIALAIPMASVGYPDPHVFAMPYAFAYTDADSLKRADALLIAMLARREEFQCPPHPQCRINSNETDTLARLRLVRQRVEAKDIPEQKGLDAVSELLDGLCPAGKRFQSS